LEQLYGTNVVLPTTTTCSCYSFNKDNFWGHHCCKCHSVSKSNPTRCQPCS